MIHSISGHPQDGILDKPNWECPDLFELPIEGEPGKKLRVLEVDIGNGSVAGGSGGEYFVGTFDGTRFRTMQHAPWVDYGRDFYAPISGNNITEGHMFQQQHDGLLRK